MFKRIICLFLFCFCISAQVQYDPTTGKPVEQKKFNPNTGEEIKQKFDPNTGKSLEVKKEGLTAKVFLTTGDVIQGKLISQDREKIIIESPIAGTVSIDREKIKKMSIGGLPISNRRSERTSAVRESDISTKDLTNEQILIIRAKNEARKNSSPYMNSLAGAGACFLAPFTGVSLPFMGLLILTDAKVKDPDSKYYKNLDLKQKNEYKATYKKETRQLRLKECFLPTLLAFGGILVLSSL